MVIISYESNGSYQGAQIDACWDNQDLEVMD